MIVFHTYLWGAYLSNYPVIIIQGKIWHIESGYACPAGDSIGCFCYSGLQTIKVGNVKTFNGKEYYELLSNISNQQWNVVTYIREEGKKVFFYTERCDKEYLMYDFNLNVGDEVVLVDPRYPFSLFNYGDCELTEDDLNEYKFKVTDIDSVEYNQVKRKRLKLNYRYPYPYLYDFWVEGIGCMRGITYHRAQQISGARQLKDCYESDELIFVNENPEFCWVSSTGVSNVQQNLINIFTDGQNILHIINAKDIPFTIYDVLGRKNHSVFPICNNYQTNISFLPKGLYIVSNNAKNINFKIVIK